MRLVVGCRLDLTDGTSLLVYPTDRAAYARLCRLLSLGKGRAGKGKCSLAWDDVDAWSEGLLAVLLGRRRRTTTLARELRRLKQIFGDRAYMALIRRFAPQRASAALASRAGRAGRARADRRTGDVLYHHPDRRMLQDVVTCIREGCTIDEAGFRPRASCRPLSQGPGRDGAPVRAPSRSRCRARIEIVERCRFSLDELRYQYPTRREPGETAQETLERLTWEGARSAIPEGVPDAVAAQLRHELKLIEELRLRAVLPDRHMPSSASRGSRASSARAAARPPTPPSATCSASPRSIRSRTNCCSSASSPQERREPPDIDVDFEHERREEVIQWIYDTYGRAPCRADRGRDPLPRPRRGARGRQGAGPAGGRDGALCPARSGAGATRASTRARGQGAQPRSRRSASAR